MILVVGEVYEKAEHFWKKLFGLLDLAFVDECELIEKETDENLVGVEEAIVYV